MAIDETSSFRQLAIVEKYERFIEYMYPIVQNCPRKHGIARDAVLRAMFAQVDLHQELRETIWYRYMDDMVVLGHDQAHLHRVREEIERFVGERLGLRFSKWSVASISRGVNFLGYRIWPSHKLLRRQSVTRAKRKIRAMRATGRLDDLARFAASWTGHAQWADSHNLMRTLELEAC